MYNIVNIKFDICSFCFWGMRSTSPFQGRSWIIKYLVLF
jgi:hypothetical protein